MLKKFVSVIPGLFEAAPTYQEPLLNVKDIFRNSLEFLGKITSEWPDRSALARKKGSASAKHGQY